VAKNEIKGSSKSCRYCDLLVEEGKSTNSRFIPYYHLGFLAYPRHVERAPSLVKIRPLKAGILIVIASSSSDPRHLVAYLISPLLTDFYEVRLLRFVDAYIYLCIFVYWQVD
jgi:hypothetical protein